MVIRLPQKSSSGKRRGTRDPPLVGPGHGAVLGGGERGGGVCAAASRARNWPTCWCWVPGRHRWDSWPGPCSLCRQPSSCSTYWATWGALPALGPQHPGCDAGRPWSGPGLGLLLPVPKPEATTQRALLRLAPLHPAPGPPRPPAGPPRALPQLPDLRVSAASRRRRPAARLCAAGP